MKSKKVSGVIFVGICILVLEGCASMNTKFDCPMKPGVNCESIDQVNAKIDRRDSDAAETPVWMQADDAKPYKTTDKNSSHFSSVDKGEVLQVWVAPYKDTVGNYHEGNRIYSVIKTPKSQPI